MKHLITEARQIEDLIGIFSKKYDLGLQAKADLQSLVLADPTAYENERGEFAGKYATWIGNLFVTGKIKAGDIPWLRSALNTYNINKSQIGKNIKEFKSLDELVQEISNYSDDFKATRTLSKSEQELEKVYEDQYVVIYVPHTWEAARKIGGNTRWCTASSSDHYFNYYKNQYGGEYYDIIRKSDGAKFQLHPESEQFMNSKDYPVDFSSIFDTEKEASGTIDFFKSIGKDVSKWVPKVYFNDIEQKLIEGKKPEEIFGENSFKFADGWHTVAFKAEWNIINPETNRLISKEWLYSAMPYADIDIYGTNIFGVKLFVNGCTPVEIEKDIWNYIRKDGTFISKENFYKAYKFNEDTGYAIIERNIRGERYNLIDKSGQLLWPYNFHHISYDGEGVYRVEKHLRDGTYRVNFLNPEEKKILYKGDNFDEWLRACGKFIGGYALITLQNWKHFNLIDRNGNLLYKKPLNKTKFSHLVHLGYGFYCAKYAQSDSSGYKILGKDGLPMSFDGITDFDGVANDKFTTAKFKLIRVQKDLKYNYAKFDGTFLFDEWLDRASEFESDGTAYVIDAQGNSRIINYNGEDNSKAEEMHEEINKIKSLMERIERC